MGLLALALFPLLLAQDPPPALPSLPSLPDLHAEVVLAGDAEPVLLGAYGLGNGGLDEKLAPDRLRWHDDGVTTSGGIRVQCQGAGVKLTFPSGRELLFAVDGVLHLRSGEQAGPFPFGAELRLGCGARVRITMAPGQRERLREVAVVDGEQVVQPWRRGKPARELDDLRPWGGVRLCCCGDGGDLYRAIGLGPMLVLERVLVAKEREAKAPAERLVLLTAALLQSLNRLPRQHTGSEAPLRRAVGAVAATADRASTIFPAGASLRRAERDQLRWVLRAGYELELTFEGPNAPRLGLFAGRSLQPMVEWTLLGVPAAYLPNPKEQPGASRWHGNGTRLGKVAEDLQARAELFEVGHALEVVKRLLK